MEKIKAFLYAQNNTFGVFDDAAEMDKIEGIYPCGKNDPIGFDRSGREYNDYAVLDRDTVPSGVYFDGVADGIDCDCCGDRWYRRTAEIELFIFKDEQDFEQNKAEMGRWDYYIVLSDFDKHDVI